MTRLINIIALFACMASSSSCEVKQDSKISKGDSIFHDTKKIDSLKWFFYAYNYKSEILFRSKITGNVNFKPVECDIAVLDVRIYNDSLITNFSFTKDSLEYLKTYNGLPINGLIFFSGLIKPLTGHVVVDDFQDSSKLLKDNHLTNHEFENYLKKADTNRISDWLKKEAKRRQLIP